MVRPIGIATPQQDPNVKLQPSAPTAGAASINSGLDSLNRGLAQLDADMEVRQQRDGELWAAKKIAEARAEWAKRAVDAENGATGDATGYAAGMDASFAEYTNNVLAEAPNRYARERAALGLTTIGGNIGANARIFEATKRVSYRGDILTETLNTEVNNVLSNGMAFDDALASYETALNAAGLPEATATKLRQRARSDLAEAQVRAMLREDPEAAIKGLEDGRWDKLLDPSRKQVLYENARTEAGIAEGNRVFAERHTSGNVTLGKKDLPPTFGRLLTGTEAPSYSTLYEHAETGKFAGTDVSKMTIAEVLEFNKPGSEYAEWMKSKGHNVAPVGAGQIIHGTLKAAVEEMGLSPDTVFSPEVQNQVVMHLAKKRLKPGMSPDEKRAAMRSEWEGFKKASDADLDRAVAEIEGGAKELPVKFANGSTPDMSGLKPEVLNGFKSLQNEWGRELPIRSGYRSAQRNKDVKGAKKSQHLHGNALDIDLSGYSKEERKQIILLAAKHGFTGFGVGATSLHIDKGPKRAWGYVRASGGGPVPDWAKETVAQALSGNYGAAVGPGKPAAGGADFSHIKDQKRRAAAEAAYRRNEADLDRKRREFMVGFDEERAFLAAGNEPPPASKFTRENLVNMFGPAEGNRLYDAKERAISDGKMFNDIKFMPPDQIAATRAELAAAASDPTALKESSRHTEAVNRLAAFDKIVADRAAKTEKDPAGYIITNSPGMRVAAENIQEKPRMYADMILQEQYAMGVKNPKILTNDMAGAMVKSIATAEPDAAGPMLAELEKQWGEHWPRVLTEMRAAGLSGGQFLAAVYAGDPGLSQKIIEYTSVGKKKIIDQIPDPADARDIQAGVRDALAPYLSEAMAGHNKGDVVGQFDELREVIETVALGDFLKGDSDSVDNAIKRFMGAKFLDPAGASNVQALIPATYNGVAMSNSMVERTTSTMLTEEAIRAFAPAVIGPDRIGGLDDTIAAAVNSGIWVNNEEGDGLVLMVPDINGALLPLRNVGGEMYVAPYARMVEDAKGTPPSEVRREAVPRDMPRRTGMDGGQPLDRFGTIGDPGAR